LIPLAGDKELDELSEPMKVRHLTNEEREHIKKLYKL
jgi:hypothetical protein